LYVTSVILPSITAEFPSKKAIRDNPSHDLNDSTISGFTGENITCAISLAFKNLGASNFFPPVSLPIFQSIFVILQAAHPHLTNPIGE